MRDLERLAYPLDRRLFGNVSSTDCENALRELKADDGDHVMQQINLEFSGLHAKASALLTHVSMMIAALAFVSSRPGIPGRWLLDVNISAYLGAVLLVLRVLAVSDELPHGLEAKQRHLAVQLYYARRYLRAGHSMVLLLTFVAVGLFGWAALRG